jgi:hypothetical protein
MINDLVPANSAAIELNTNIAPWYQWPNYVPYFAPPVNIVHTTVPQRCAWCQGHHYEKCPRLKSVTYRDDGTVEHIEFFPADT